MKSNRWVQWNIHSNSRSKNKSQCISAFHSQVAGWLQINIQACKMNGSKIADNCKAKTDTVKDSFLFSSSHLYSSFEHMPGWEEVFFGGSVSGEGRASGRTILKSLAEIPCRNIIISVTINVFTINEEIFLPSSVHSFVSRCKQYFLSFLFWIWGPV